MSPLIRHQVWILLAAGLVFFVNLGRPTLFDEDEPKNAECGREMLVRGDWIVPTFNEDLRTDKPILVYWLMLVSYKLLGVTELAARLWSAILAVGTSLLTYHLGRKLFSAEVGLLGGLILCTSLMFAAVGRAVTPDSVLIFCTTLAFTAYVWAVAARHEGVFGGRVQTTGSDQGGRHSCLPGNPNALGQTEMSVPLNTLPAAVFVPTTWQQSLPMSAAMGFAVLAKGPVGVLLPCTVIGLFLLLLAEAESRPASQDQSRGIIARGVRFVGRLFAPRRFFAACGWMRIPLAALIVAAIALPWYVAVGLKTDGAWLAGFLGGHNVHRFLAPMENHSGPIVYYIPAVFAGFFPWSVFLPVALIQLHRRLREGDGRRAGSLLLTCWLLVYFVFFSLAGTKLPNYVLPMYPALALLVACFLHDWQREAATQRARRFVLSCRMLAGVGVLMMLALPIVSLYLLPGEAWLGALGAIPLVGAGLAFWFARWHQRPRAVRALVGMAVCLAVTMMGFAAPRVSRHQNSESFAAAARAFGGDRIALATYEYFAPSLVFYAEQRVLRLKQPEEIQTYFAEADCPLLITRADRLDQLKNVLPADITTLARQPRFLRRHDLVLLGRRPQLAAAAASTPTR